MTRIKQAAAGGISVVFTGFFLVLLAISKPVWAGSDPEPAHGIAMYGAPALANNFSHLPYANPDAPKGGAIIFGENGGFDSLNPYIQKGNSPYGVRIHTYETLLGRNWDEPFALYGLLAQTVQTGPERGWVEFTLRDEARFSDDTPVTVDDVIWSFETLGTKGHGRYANSWKNVKEITQTGPKSVRITFKEPDFEAPLIMGLRPILKAAQWDSRDFEDSSLDIPIGSGPYLVDRLEANRFITFRRNPQYWGRDLGFNRGRHNIDAITYDYYRDAGVIFEAFKAGEISVVREGNAAKWATEYDFPAMTSGDIVTAEIPHQRPSGMNGLVFNTRRAPFADWRVREALILAFNFEFINQTLNGGQEARVQSFFSNSVLGMQPGPAQGRVLDLLLPFKSELLSGALEGYSLPISNGDVRNRRNLRQAQKMLTAAGWRIQDGVLRNDTGDAFTFSVLLRQGDADNEAIMGIYSDALLRLGIAVETNIVDAAQFVLRSADYDFDVVYGIWGLSLSPGNEQRYYFGSAGRNTPGSRNRMGVASPAVDAMIDGLLSADDPEDFTATVRALDRLLTTGRYVIPFWYGKVSRLAYKSELRFPKKLPIYGDWPGFLPDVWWSEE